MGLLGEDGVAAGKISSVKDVVSVQMEGGTLR